MKNNCPECIAESVVLALSFRKLEKVPENGGLFMEEHITFKKYWGNWDTVLQDLE